MKTLKPYELDFKLIRDAMERGDYGLALYSLVVLEPLAISDEDIEAIKAAHGLEALVRSLIHQDFLKIAMERRLTVTQENFGMLIEEHSPHYIRFRELVTSNLN